MAEDITSSFRKNIETMDYYRSYHKKWKSTRYSGWGSLERQLWLAKMCDGNIRKYDMSLWKKVQKECREMGETPPIPKKERFYLLSLLTTILLTVFFFFAFMMFRLILFAILSFPTIIVSTILALLVIKEGLSLSRKAIQKSYEQKNLTQELIDNAIDFFRKEKINPEEYPLRLRFNDYKRLKYVKEVRKFLIRKEYIAYLDLNVPNIPKVEEEISEEEISREAVRSFILTSIFLTIALLLMVVVMILLHRHGILK